MARTHYIVRLSKLALVPGRILMFSRGDEVPASISEIRTEDEDEACRIAREHMHFDGQLAKVTKVYRNGRREEISNGFNNSGFLSPEDREVLKVEGLHCRCRQCGWSFTVHVGDEIMRSEAYGPDTEWFCPHCGKGVKAEARCPKCSRTLHGGKLCKHCDAPGVRTCHD